MKTEQVVLNYVKPLCKQFKAYKNPEWTLDALALKAKRAGFTLYAEEELRRQQITNQEVLELIGSQLKLKLRIERPGFSRVIFDISQSRTKRQIVETTTFVDMAIPIATRKVKSSVTKDFAHMLPIQKTEIIYMLEVRPQDFKGEIPEFALDAALKCHEAGLVCRVWVAGTKQELAQYIRKEVTRIVIDPILVAYANEPKPTVPQQCLFVAAWGTDLEPMNEFFEKRGRPNLP